MTGQNTNRQLQALIDRSPLSIVDKETCYSVCRSIISSKDGVRPIEVLDLLLNSISLSHEPSYVPLACLSFILRSTSDSWPVFDLIRCHSRLWRALPENFKSGNDPKSSTMVAESMKQVKASYQSLLQLLHPDCDKPAISDPHHHKSLSHRALSKYINDFRIPVPIYTNTKPIIVVALPNGTLLALACMAVATYYTAAPINPTSGAEQFQNDVLQTKSKAILVCRSHLERLGLNDPWATEACIDVFVVDEKHDMTFDVSPLNRPCQSIDHPRIPNSPDDIAFVFFTSGTNGMKKMVPLSIHNLLLGVAFIIESWHLTDDDVCLNMMPLNHVYVPEITYKYNYV